MSPAQSGPTSQDLVTLAVTVVAGIVAYMVIFSIGRAAGDTGVLLGSIAAGLVSGLVVPWLVVRVVGGRSAAAPQGQAAAT